MILGKHLYLNYIKDRDDYHFIYEKFCLDDLYLWSNKNSKQTYFEFQTEMNEMLKSHYRSFYVIYENNSDKRMGFIFAYNIRNIDSHAFVTIYICEEYRNKIYSVEAAVLYLNHLFEKLSLNKVFFEVYSYNQNSISLMQFPGVIREATLKEYRKHNDEYYDLYIYSLTKKSFINNQVYLEAIKW